jgi:hypothetical protein
LPLLSFEEGKRKHFWDVEERKERGVGREQEGRKEGRRKRGEGKEALGMGMRDKQTTENNGESCIRVE